MRIRTRERYILIGGDYSQQEPKLLAVLCQDENMMRDADEGKDLYASIASRAFHTTYEECLEHFPENCPIKKENKKWRYATEEEIKNKDYDKLADGITDTYSDGKNRRKQAKVILLGLMYGRGSTALAEQLNCSREEAQDIMNSVFDAFPKIKEYDEKSKTFAKKNGYATTLWGRKRRLSDIKLQPYEFDFSDSLVTAGKNEFIKDMVKQLEMNYWNRDKKQQVIDNAYKNYKVKIKDNTGFIARAERQIINSCVQGSAADMSKKAIVKINEDEKLRELGFHMIVPIHDEILGMAPLANAKECKELFTYDMEHCAEDRVPLNITVDPTCSFKWYGDEVEI